MTHHNYFFYFRKEMPWKNALQDKRTKRSGKTRQKVASAEKAQNQEGSDSASKST